MNKELIEKNLKFMIDINDKGSFVRATAFLTYKSVSRTIYFSYNYDGALLFFSKENNLYDHTWHTGSLEYNTILPKEAKEDHILTISFDKRSNELQKEIIK